jgi:hypothetical protein
MKIIIAMSFVILIFISCSSTSLIKRDTDCTLREDTTTGRWFPPEAIAKRFLEKNNIDFYPDSVDVKGVNYFGEEWWITFKLKKPINDWSGLKVNVAISKDGCASFLDFK